MGLKLLWLGFTAIVVLNRVRPELSMVGAGLMVIGCVLYLFDK